MSTHATLLQDWLSGVAVSLDYEGWGWAWQVCYFLGLGYLAYGISIAIYRGKYSQYNS
jgi:hypothetical protein